MHSSSLSLVSYLLSLVVGREKQKKSEVKSSDGSIVDAWLNMLRCVWTAEDGKFARVKGWQIRCCCVLHQFSAIFRWRLQKCS